MKRPYLVALAAVMVSLVAAPVQAFAPALVFAFVAAGVVGTAVGAAVNQTGRDVWIYTNNYGWVGGAREDVSTINAPLVPRPGTSKRIVSACRDAIAKNAEPYDVASLEAVSAGKQTRVKGRTVAPIEVRTIYRVRGAHEVKRSTVRCEVDRVGRVISMS